MVPLGVTQFPLLQLPLFSFLFYSHLIIFFFILFPFDKESRMRKNETAH